MYRVILLTLGLVLLVEGKNKMSKCGRLVHGGLACCNKDNMKHLPKPGDFSECDQLRKPPPSCDMEICIGQKMGFVQKDGTIDMKAFADMTDKKLENDPDLADRIKDNCIAGDLSKYGEEDICDLFRLKMCSDVQFVKSCTDWKDDGECKGIKELAAECTKEFD